MEPENGWPNQRFRENGAVAPIMGFTPHGVLMLKRGIYKPKFTQNLGSIIVINKLWEQYNA